MDQRKQYIPLPRRVAALGVAAVVLAALWAGALAFPGWKLDHDLHEAMVQAGEADAGVLLWEGRTEDARILVYQGEENLYWGQLGRYEGKASLHVAQHPVPEAPAVVLLEQDLLWAEDCADQLMALALPEGTAGGSLSVALGPGLSRDISGVWDQGLLLFAPPARWVEYEWGLDKYGLTPYSRRSLSGLAYTLTLWDEGGTVLARSAGTI